MNLTKIVSIVLLLIAVALAGYLWNSISSTIKEQESIRLTEGQITEKLQVIRAAQKVLREYYGR
ncbi:MAG: hypothetical protein LOY03_13100, partial [Cyclobacteriaceae bacterium]|nr:hypothetical protein [Cyclobacteriaceae bacterium]